MRKTCVTCRHCKEGAPMEQEPCNSCEVITGTEFSNWEPPKQTNADRIRSMSDDELVGVLLEQRCKYCNENDICPDVQSCYILVERWLKEEVDGT